MYSINQEKTSKKVILASLIVARIYGRLMVLEELALITVPWLCCTCASSTLKPRLKLQAKVLNQWKDWPKECLFANSFSKAIKYSLILSMLPYNLPFRQGKSTRLSNRIYCRLEFSSEKSSKARLNSMKSIKYNNCKLRE